MRHFVLITLSILANISWLGLTVLYFLPHMIDWSPFWAFVGIVGITAMILLLAMVAAGYITNYVFERL